MNRPRLHMEVENNDADHYREPALDKGVDTLE